MEWTGESRVVPEYEPFYTDRILAWLVSITFQLWQNAIAQHTTKSLKARGAFSCRVKHFLLRMKGIKDYQSWQVALHKHNRSMREDLEESKMQKREKGS